MMMKQVFINSQAQAVVEPPMEGGASMRQANTIERENTTQPCQALGEQCMGKMGKNVRCPIVMREQHVLPSAPHGF